MLHTVSVDRHVIGNTDQYTKLSCAVEQLNRAAATDLIIFSRKIGGWKERQPYAKRNQFSWFQSGEKGA
jgi:hypothetical protein